MDRWAACNLVVVLLGVPYFLRKNQARHGGSLVWILSNAFDLPRINEMRNHFPSTDFRVA
jgi:hypothetical protein